MTNFFNSSVALILNELIMLICDYFCSLYVFTKATKVTTRAKKIVITLVIVIIVLFSLSFFEIAFIIDRLYIKILFILIACVSFAVLFEKPSNTSIPLSLISVSLSFCLEYFSVFVSGTLLFVIGFREKNVISTFCSAVLQILFTLFIMKIKPFRNGIRYLGNNKNFGLGLLISSYSIVFCFLLSQYQLIGSKIGVILFLGIPLTLVGLILWIRSIVQRYYKNKLQDRMDEYTKQEIEGKDQRIERLEIEVATLAKQLHRDNHLMSSLDRSVNSLAECETEEQREQIIGEIQTMYSERNELIAKEQQQNKILPSTGIALIDGSVSELYVKAAAHGIGFDLTVNEELHYLVNNIISQTDLQTLLCDHIKDAIIAVESAGITDGRILVTIAKNDGIFEIAIRDNGVDFEAGTLAKLGREQVTTHADDGGSGFGFLTTFETLRKTKGSLLITEYEQKTPFSKSVAFIFDGLNCFVISTYRKDELEHAIDRDDVKIIC